MTSVVQIYGVYESLNIAYTNKFYPWELGQVKPNFWADKNNRVMAIRWLVEKKCKLSTNKEIIQRFEAKLMRENGLGWLLVTIT